MLSFSVVLSLLPCVASHGWMSKPLAVQPGAADTNLEDKYGGPKTRHYRDAASWFTQDTRTSDGKNPGQNPGSAPIHASCGVHHWQTGDTQCGTVAKLNKPWNIETKAQGSGEYKNEPSVGETRHCDARRYLASASVQETWTAGGTAGISWVPDTNHGGAVGYRLCAYDKVKNAQDVGPNGATERCFQEGHLEFFSRHTYVHCPHQQTPRAYIGNDITGANGNVYRQYSFLPHCADGVAPDDYCKNPDKIAPCTVNGYPSINLRDQVKVPSGLKGKFVLSMRWDCGTTPQVWQNCAVIEIVPQAEDAMVNATDLVLL